MSILKRKSVIGLVTISVAGLIAACSQTVTPPEADDESSEVIEATDSEEASDEKADEKADEKSEEVSKDKESSKGEVSSKDDDSKDDSSSKDDGEGSDASEGTSSSSEEPSSSDSSSDAQVKGEDTIISENGGTTNVNVGTNDMDEVSNEEADKLDSLLKEEELPEGVEKIEGGINGGDIDVGNNDYYCYTGEGWLKINFDNLKETGLPFLWNGAAFGLRKKYDMFFDDACEAVYAVRK